MSDDTKPTPVNLPDTEAESLDEFRRENSHIFGIRNWLQEAVEANGAVMTGGGCGMGAADIDIKFEGRHYNIQIKPLVAQEPAQ